MNASRLALFVVLVIVFGLLQLWILPLIVILLGRPLDLLEILADGSLLFFATSLSYASFFTILGSPDKYSANRPPLTISVFVVFLISAIAVSTYTIAYVSQHSGTASSFSFSLLTYVVIQIVCAIVAVCYSIYAAAITKAFVPPIEYAQNIDENL